MKLLLYDDSTLACDFQMCSICQQQQQQTSKPWKKKEEKLQMWSQTQHLKKPKEIDGNPIIKIFALIIR